jgi:hypothetical protein
VGCCQKITVDLIQWDGLAQIAQKSLQLQRSAGAQFPDSTLDSIIASPATVSISTLTIGFLLCFFALHLPTLRIKQISRFLARKTGRIKSTLCKLYQIAHILGAAGVVLRSDIPGEVTIADRFFVPVELDIPDEPMTKKKPLGIDFILNRPPPDSETPLRKRRQEFFVACNRPSGNERTRKQ